MKRTAKLIAAIKKVLQIFPAMMTGISLAAAAYIELFWDTDTSHGAALIWQLALCALLCSVTVLFADKKREPSNRKFLLYMLLNFLYINAVVMLCGFLFEWFRAEDLGMLLGMEGTIVVVFAIICSLFYRRAKKDAALVNERLQKNV